MVEPTAKTLLSKLQSEAGSYGKSSGTERETLLHDMTLAKMAYRTAKFMDDSPVAFTQKDADYLCSIIASRVGGVE